MNGETEYFFTNCATCVVKCGKWNLVEGCTCITVEPVLVATCIRQPPPYHGLFLSTVQHN